MHIMGKNLVQRVKKMQGDREFQEKFDDSYLEAYVEQVPMTQTQMSAPIVDFSRNIRSSVSRLDPGLAWKEASFPVPPKQKIRRLNTNHRSESRDNVATTTKKPKSKIQQSRI